MTNESMLFTAALFGYLFAFFGHVFAVGLNNDGLYRASRLLMILAALAASAGLGVRWYEAGHPPLSNMYESLVTLSTFLAWVTLGFTHSSPFGLAEGGSAVLAVLMTGIASLFPQEARPLVPALQSYWLHVHVAISFVGEACFALSFLLSYLFCFRRLLVAGDTTTQASTPAPTQAERTACSAVVYGLPALFLFGMTNLLLKLNNDPTAGGKWHSLLFWVVIPTIILSIALLAGLYVLRGSIGKTSERILPSEERLDEFTYRAIALGFPLFTVGALIFGMVWANKAWGRYWGWDPKETWALITFLVYAIYLHLRLTKGLRGTWTAILSVVGFLVTLFTLFGVNLILSGLHSYASS